MLTGTDWPITVKVSGDHPPPVSVYGGGDGRKERRRRNTCSLWLNKETTSGPGLTPRPEVGCLTGFNERGVSGPVDTEPLPANPVAKFCWASPVNPSRNYDAMFCYRLYLWGEAGEHGALAGLDPWKHRALMWRQCPANSNNTHNSSFPPTWRRWALCRHLLAWSRGSGWEWSHFRPHTTILWSYGDITDIFKTTFVNTRFMNHGDTFGI